MARWLVVANEAVPYWLQLDSTDTEPLHEKSSSAVFLNGSVGEWFMTSIHAWKGWLFSPTIFNIFLDRIMKATLEDHQGNVSIAERSVSNLRFAADVGLPGLLDYYGPKTNW